MAIQHVPLYCGFFNRVLSLFGFSYASFRTPPVCRSPRGVELVFNQALPVLTDLGWLLHILLVVQTLFAKGTSENKLPYLRPLTEIRPAILCGHPAFAEQRHYGLAQYWSSHATCHFEDSAQPTELTLSWLPWWWIKNDCMYVSLYYRVGSSV